MRSGFNSAPGTPERRDADRGFIDAHRVAAVKNPRRYSDDAARAFGLTGRRLDPEDGWTVTLRGVAISEYEFYETLDELLDAGWTVD